MPSIGHRALIRPGQSPSSPSPLREPPRQRYIDLPGVHLRRDSLRVPCAGTVTLECVVGLGPRVEGTTQRRLDQSKVAAVAWRLRSFTRRARRSSGIGEKARRVSAQRVEATGDPVHGLGCVVEDTDACVHEVVRLRPPGAGRIVRGEILHERDVTAVLGEAAVRQLPLSGPSLEDIEIASMRDGLEPGALGGALDL
jgi:hypothetical protein